MEAGSTFWRIQSLKRSLCVTKSDLVSFIHASKWEKRGNDYGAAVAAEMVVALTTWVAASVGVAAEPGNGVGGNSTGGSGVTLGVGEGGMGVGEGTSVCVGTAVGEGGSVGEGVGVTVGSGVKVGGTTVIGVAVAGVAATVGAGGVAGAHAAKATTHAHNAPNSRARLNAEHAIG